MPKGVPNKRYTPEFKRMVVETMKKEHLSIYATMQKFGINDHKIIERWERIYLEEGPEVFSSNGAAAAARAVRRSRCRRQINMNLPKRKSQQFITKTMEDTAIAALQQNFATTISS